MLTDYQSPFVDNNEFESEAMRHDDLYLYEDKERVMIDGDQIEQGIDQYSTDKIIDLEDVMDHDDEAYDYERDRYDEKLDLVQLAYSDDEEFEGGLNDEFTWEDVDGDEITEFEAFHHGESWEGEDEFEEEDDLFYGEVDEFESDEFLELEETGSRIVDYNIALKHALKNLKPAGFGVPWRSGGSGRAPGEFDTQYWTKRVDPKPGRYLDRNGKWKRYRWSMLEIINNGDAYDAIKAIINHPKKWTFECATFIQAAHLYALAVSRGKRRTNAFYAKKKLRLRFHWSPGLRTRKGYRKDARSKPWRVRSDGSERHVRLTDAKLLQSTPYGSRVMWHNIKGERDWKNENTVKVGNNLYRGFPLFGAMPVKGWKIQMGLAAHQVYKDHYDALNSILNQLKHATGTDVQQNKKLQDLWRYTKKNIYLREVVIIGPDPRV